MRSRLLGPMRVRRMWLARSIFPGLPKGLTHLMRCSLLIIGSLCLLLPALSMGRTPPERGYFDPDRHMRVADVREGMKGYGLSVFSGTEIERFDVEVISVLRSFNVKGDVILIRCAGQNLEHTGPVAGMSGSPIYLYDDKGDAKMVGAFAYGWPLVKDPIAGVQPIEYMLDIRAPVQAGAAHATAQHPTAGEMATTIGPRQWTLPSNYWNGWASQPRAHPLLRGLGAASDQPHDASAMRLEPLATPLMTSGLPPHVEQLFRPILASAGFVALQAGGSGDGGDGRAIDIEPGSVLAIPLLTGDMDLTAIGTATEVIGDRVFGFGHPFNAGGPVELPMGNGRVHTIIPSLMTSFKLGAMADMRGTLTHDETFGVSGVMGDAPPMIPIELRVIYPEMGEDRLYRFEAASHPQFTPLLSSIALMSAVTGLRELPPHHTIDYDLVIEFENDRTIRMKNTVPDSFSGAFFFHVGMPMMEAANNPFEQVMVRSLRGEVRIDLQSRQAEILSVILPRTRYHPGETVQAFVLHRPFRGAETILPVEMQLPRELPDGEYHLSVNDWRSYLNEEQMSKPFRFVAEDVDEVFDVISDVMGVQQEAIYIRLLREADGVAVGRTAMPHLPSSRRQIILSAGRSNTTPFVSSTVNIIPTDYVMSGSAQFAITIERDTKVQPPGRPRGDAARPRQPANDQPAPANARESDESAPARQGSESAPTEPGTDAESQPQPAPAE